MKKGVFSLLLILLLCATIPGAQALEFSSYAVTVHGDVALLDSADTNSMVIAVLSKATLLYVTHQQTNGDTVWYQVINGGQTGYVSSGAGRLLTVE